MRDLSEKYANKGVVVVAVNGSNPTAQPENPQDVQRFAIENRLAGRSFAIALDGRAAALMYGVASQHTWFLIDRAGRIALKGSGWNEGEETRVTQRIDVLTGNIAPDFGWRRDISASFQRAEEAYAAGKLDEALKEIQVLMPPKTLVVEADYKLVPPEFERGVRGAVARAISEWRRQLGSVVEIELREIGSDGLLKENEKSSDTKKEKKKDKEEKKPEKPNVELKFQRTVIDPADDSGLRTICSVIRVLNEREMGMTMRQGEGASPFYVLARIALGHQGETHSAAAITHLVGASIARALGLEDRDETTSIAKGGDVDSTRNPFALTPSREDMMALGNLIASMNLRAGEIYLQQKKYDQARESFQLVAALRVGTASERASQYLRTMPPAAGAAASANAGS